jgi:hypothetical protein
MQRGRKVVHVLSELENWPSLTSPVIVQVTLVHALCKVDFTSEGAGKLDSAI